jgi:serine/threonine protein kinase/class 3 adenylate cyclase
LGEAGVLYEERRLALARADRERWRHLRARLTLVAGLKHPAVRRFREIDLDAETPRLVVEAPGRTLLDCIAHGGLPLEEALGMVRTLASALTEAHRLGLAHGCICPGHVALVTGEPVIDLAGTDTGDHLELEPYAGACRAADAWVTPASDVYALAALLSVLVSGKLPREGVGPVGGERGSWLLHLTAEMLERAAEKRPSIELVCNRLAGPVTSSRATTGRLPGDPTLTADGVAATQVMGASEVSVGAEVGRYRLEQLLGEGGMGRVYRAVDTASGEVVALKLMHSWVRDQAARERFSREARLLAEIDSPNVARLFEAGSAGDMHFLAMEYVEGPSLGIAIKERGSLPEAEALAIAADVARGLADIHSVGIVHRDVKPSNVILVAGEGDAPPRAKLCDLGIARRIDMRDTAQITRAGAFVGTPQYMAPEQCMGQEVDGRADVYSLGATLYAALTGRPPFNATDLAVIIGQQLNDMPADVRELAPDVSDELGELVMRALAKAPEHRFYDALDLLEAVEMLRRGEASRNIGTHPRLPHQSGDRVVSYVLELELDSSPEELWPYVSNTDRLNRSIGLGAVAVERRLRDGEPETLGRAQTFGFGLVWREHPFEWVSPQRFGVVRVFKKGPLYWYRSTVEMTATGSGTALRHTIEAAPRGMFGRLAAAFEIGVRTRRALARVYRRIDRLARESAASGATCIVEDPFEASPRLSGPGLVRLQQVAARMVAQGCQQRVVDTLVDYLSRAPAPELARIRPRTFARRFELAPADVLRTFLHGAREGALTLRWDILCPSCRSASAMADALSQIREHGHCDVCNIDFELNFASSIELVFQVHAQIRRADGGLYCIGGPAHRPHVLAQVSLAPGERFAADMRLPPGRYRVLTRDAEAEWSFRVSRDAPLPRLEISLQRGISPDRPRSVAAGRQQLVLCNDMDRPALVRVERDSGDSEALTAAQAVCTPEFRNLFPGELLSPGVLVGVSRIAVLVVELHDQALLRDAQAEEWPLYRALAALREETEKAVELEGGCVVKLHGDGVMAVFSEPVAAVRAGMALVASSDALSARMAVHHGPSMVTTINQRLDYFGKLVYRLHELCAGAGPGELALSEAIVADPGVAELLRAPAPGVEMSRRSAGQMMLRRA